jgi:hypothetical protein
MMKSQKVSLLGSSNRLLRISSFHRSFPKRFRQFSSLALLAVDLFGNASLENAQIRLIPAEFNFE